MACVLAGVILRTWLGYATGSSDWSWKYFFVTTILSFLGGVTAVFTIEPVLSLEVIVGLVLSVVAVGELQSKVVKLAGSNQKKMLQ